jgi:hypothetical protein
MTGRPERVAAYYQSLVDVGTQYFVIQIDARDTETIELLANQVVPVVAGRVAMLGATPEQQER